MRLLFSVLKIIIINFLVIVGIALIVLLPRERTINSLVNFDVDVNYVFQSSEYLTKIKTYFTNRISNKDLGFSSADRMPAFEALEASIFNSLKLFGFSLAITFIVGSLLIYFINLFITRNNKSIKKIPKWFKIPDIFLFIVVFCFSSFAFTKSSYINSVFLVSILPTIYMIRSRVNKSESEISFPSELKQNVLFFLLHLKNICLRALAGVFLVEWLFNLDGLFYKFLSFADFTHRTFSRAQRDYEYDLIIFAVVFIMMIVFLAEWISYLTKRIINWKIKGFVTGVIKKLVIQFSLIIALIFIILIPQGGNHDFEGPGYVLDTQRYKDNIVTLVENVITEQSLGTVRSGATIEAEIGKFYPESIKVIISAFIFTLCFGFLKGLFDYNSRYGKYRILGKFTTSVTASFPDFLFFLIIQWYLIFNVQSLKVMGHEHWYAFIFLGMLISIHPIMYFAYFITNALEDEAGEPYVQVARAKGLTRSQIMKRHLLKNIIVPVSNYLPAILLYIISNLIIAEWFFLYQGGAYRLLYSMNIGDKIESVTTSISNGPLILGLIICFLIPFFLVQILTLLLKHKFGHIRRER